MKVQHPNSPRFIDRTGQQCGDYFVLHFIGKPNGSVYWRCRCVCGQERDVSARNLSYMKEGQGCGCRGWQRVREARTTHGLGKHPLYGLWLQVLYRCEKTTHVAYHHYGGRGIRVCEGWHDIKNFIQDNAERPSRKYTLDRIDNNGHYSCGKCSECLQNEWPANCQWSTKQVQNNHTRQNRMITINNRTQSMADWARENGLKYRTVRGRIERGWDDIEAVSVPLQRGGRRPVI